MRLRNDSINKQQLQYDQFGSLIQVVANRVLLTDTLASSAIIKNPKGDRISPNPWNYEITLQSNLTGDAYYYAGNYGSGPNPLKFIFKGPINPGGLPVIDYETFRKASSVYNRALGKLNEKVRGGLDLSVALAESHQTRKMLKSITKAERYIQGIGPKRWANEWLQLKYGWQPLLSDVYGAANELLEVVENMTTFTAKAHSFDDLSGSVTSPLYYSPTGTGHATELPVVQKYKAKAFNACKLSVTLALPSNAARAARWSSLNPVSIAWELMPYSFVIDWFIDIGSYLRDMETAYLYSAAFRTGQRSDLFNCKIDTTLDYSYFNQNYSDMIKYIKAAGGRRRLDFKRVLLTSYPSPNLPRINTDLSPGRLLTAAALLTQFLPLTKPVRARFMDLARPYRSYVPNNVKDKNLKFKTQQDWAGELRW